MTEPHHAFTPVYLPHSHISGHVPLSCGHWSAGKACGRRVEDPVHQPDASSEEDGAR